MDERADFVRRRWCVWVAVGLLALGAVLNLWAIFGGRNFDLTEDESHYWMWSRFLDYGYYSKPPGIAWVIWLAVKVGRAVGLGGDGSGAAMVGVVRLPAVLFGVVSGLVSWGLARRMFRDDRAGLVVILLSAAVPMFAIGGLLITIDSPMYMCWGVCLYCLWRAVEGGGNGDLRFEIRNLRSERGNPKSEIRNPKGEGAHGSGDVDGGGWVFWLYCAGVVCGVGMMFKPVLIAVPLCAVVAGYFDRGIRRVVWGRHGLGAFLVAMSSLVPMVVWNSRHGWVMFRHIGTQGGMGGKGSGNFHVLSSVGGYVGGQAGGMGGLMFVLLVIAVVVGVRFCRRVGMEGGGDEGAVGRAGAYRFLLWFSVPLWGFYLLLSFWKGTEPNWPAASYFAGMILLAGVMTEGWNSVDAKMRRGWRVWGTAAIVWGVLLTGVAMNLQRFYPLAAEHLEAFKGTDRYMKSWWYPGKWDLAKKKLRGMEERAAVVEGARARLAKEMGVREDEVMVVTNRYDTSSSLTFYMPGHPFVYCLMSSLDRGNQYDLWAGANEVGADGRLVNGGRSAVLVGFDDEAAGWLLRPAFERLEGPVEVPFWYQGVMMGTVTVYRGYGFKGFPVRRAGGF